MSRDVVIYLEDMAEAVRRVLAYTRGMDRAALFADLRTIDAVVRNLEVLGEAAKHVPDEIRVRYREIEWKKISGLRDVLAHEYFAVDDDIVWDVVMNKLPALLPRIEECLLAERSA